MTDLTASIDTLTGNPGGSALLTSHRMPLPATFSFDYFGMPFEVSIRRMAEGGAEFVLQGRLGSFPYSAESVAAREFLLSLVDAGRYLPLIDLNIDRKQSIVAQGMMAFQAIPSLAAGAAAIAIAIKPVCELIAKSHHLPNP